MGLEEELERNQAALEEIIEITCERPDSIILFLPVDSGERLAEAEKARLAFPKLFGLEPKLCSAENALLSASTRDAKSEANPLRHCVFGIKRMSIGSLTQQIDRLPRSLSIYCDANWLSGSMAFRAFLLKHYYIRWLVWIDNERVTCSIPAVISRLVLIRAIAKGSSTPPLLRVASIMGNDLTASVDRIRECRRMKSVGDYGRTIIIASSESLLPGMPWFFGSFQKDHFENLGAFSELIKIGEAVHLRDVAALLRPIAKGAFGKDDIDEDESTPGDKGVPCYCGSDVCADGTLRNPSRYVPRDSVDKDNLLLEGDILVPSVYSGTLLPTARISAKDLPAVGSRVVVIRFKNEDERNEPVSDYLRSREVGEYLAVYNARLKGDSLLDSVALGYLPIPRPSMQVMHAMSVLVKLEAKYSELSAALKEKRESLFGSFSARTYRWTSEELLKAEMEHSARIRAAEYAVSREARILNRMPHPVAYRLEKISLMEYGRERIEASLRCIELAYEFVTFIAYKALKAVAPESTEQAQRLVADWAGREKKIKAHLSWGLAKNLLINVLTRIAEKPVLEHGFPDFAFLKDAIQGEDGKWANAEALLVEWRNEASHLHELTEDDYPEKSKELDEAMNVIIDRLLFLESYPLVQVRDYASDPDSGEKRARYEMLVGSHSVFRFEERVVEEALDKDAIGILDRKGVFHSLQPWLRRYPCKKCKRDEIFIFNRIMPSQAVFVAMESGHGHIFKEQKILSRLRKEFNLS